MKKRYRPNPGSRDGSLQAHITLLYIIFYQKSSQKREVSNTLHSLNDPRKWEYCYLKIKRGLESFSLRSGNLGILIIIKTSENPY